MQAISRGRPTRAPVESRVDSAKRNGVLGPEELEIFSHHMGHVEMPTDDNKLGRVAKVVESSSLLDSVWTIEDFSSLCIAAINQLGEHKFNLLLKGLIETITDETMQSKLSWQMSAVNVDVKCQYFFPFAYTLSLIGLFSMIRNLPDPIE